MIVVMMGAGVLALLFWPDSEPRRSPKAVIVDQLALTDPNPGFVQRATRLLTDAGYLVDYFDPQAVSVDFYGNLPKGEYELIVIRSHSSQQRNAVGEVGAVTQRDEVALFTNELYSTTAHVDDQLRARLGIGSYPERGIAAKFFVIDPAFVMKSMRGRFHGSTVILMGCGGLSSDSMAKAFIARGARAFVSWNDKVTASHTDLATETLLQHLVVDGLEAGPAVARTMVDAGPDRAFGARLLAYP